MNFVMDALYKEVPMLYQFKMALMNITRAKRRTILTFLMLSFGIIFYIIMESMLQGFDDASFKNMIDFETGHIKIRSQKYDEDRPYDIENFLEDTAPIIDNLKNKDFITAYTERVQFLAQLDNSIDTSPVIVSGIDNQKDRTVFTLNKYIIQGKLKDGGLLIGTTLAEDMGLAMNDPVYITFRDIHGMYTSIERTITGIIKSPDPRVNNAAVYITLQNARQNLAIRGASEVCIKTIDYEKADIYKKQLIKQLPQCRIESWRDISTDFAALMATKRKASSYILLFIIIIALVGIINTLLMSVYEKRQEIGTLMALGMEQHEVRNIFIMEGFIIGLAGSIVGLFLGTIFNLYFIYVGLDYTAMLGDNTGGLNVMGIVKSVWVIPSYFKALIVVTLASVLSSYYPAKKVMKMEPAECLRTVQ